MNEIDNMRKDHPMVSKALDDLFFILKTLCRTVDICHNPKYNRERMKPIS